MGIRRFFGLLLALALLTGTAAAESRYPDKEHLPVDFSSMERTGFDEARIQAAMKELRALCGSPDFNRESDGTRARVRELYDRILRELDVLSTQSALADIYYDANGAEASAAEASAVLSEQVGRLYDAAWDALSPLVDTPYRDILEADAGAENVEALRHYDRMTEEEAALYREEERLVQAYDQAMAKPVLIDGREWTEAAVEEAELDDDAYWTLRTQLERAQNQAVGEIYRQLVQVRTKIARAAGYDNYAEYAYETVYNRDYGMEDMEALRESVKEKLVPLSEWVLGGVSDAAIQALENRSCSSGEEILDAIEPFVGEIHPELAESFVFMRAHHLYDIEARPDKLPVGYTVALPAYGSAFIFNSPYGTYQDYSDTIHEFGHFNETFHAATHTLWADFSIDVGEIHSQALELLFTAYADELFSNYGYVYTALTVYNLLDSVLEGCMYDEFETEVYQNPQLTLEEINRRFKEISEQYGYYYEDGEEGCFWVQISHNFQSPLYYTSYATSALSALELWLWSLEDRQQAVECYMDLTALSLDLPYRAAVKQAGLKDIFRRGAVGSIAKDLEAASSRNWKASKRGPEPVIALCMGGGGVMLVALVLKSLQKEANVEPFPRRRKEKDPWEL